MFIYLCRMPDINDLRARLLKLKQEIQQALPDIALTNTITAKALVERKIREVGFGAKYSNNKLPAWFFLHKEKSKAGEAYIKSKIKDKERMNWSDLRQAEGLPVDHVDLSFTNKTWAGLGPQQPYFEGDIIICRLGGNTVEVVNKLNYNRIRYGDFFGKVLGKKEVDILTTSVLAQIGVILKNNGF